MTNACSATWSATYDALDRPAAYTDPLSHTTTAAYDAATGDLSESEDALGNATTFAYDDLGRLASVSRPTDGITPAVTQYAYDAADNLVTVTDPLGHATDYG